MRVHHGTSPVAEAMRRYRSVHGLSQRAAAERLGTSRNNWDRCERAVVWPDPAWRKRILALVAGQPEAAPNPFAVACRAFRQREAVTQAEAADLIGVDERTWRRWENGEALPKRHSREFWRRLNKPAAVLRARKKGAA